MKKTPLYDIHKRLGAKMVEFANWCMPVMYTGIRQEHLAVRKKAGMFDVSHMGIIEVKGPHSFEYSQRFTTNDLSKIDIFRAQYTLLCNEQGGIIDDVIVYMFSWNHFLFCINAINTEKVYRWFLTHSKEYDVDIRDSTFSYSQIALQGPKAVDILKEVLGKDVSEIKRFHFSLFEWGKTTVMSARTGYTGEDGFELFLSWEEGPRMWEGLARVGEAFGLKYCGLGARDTLRLEMGFPLYGCELSEDVNPFEVELGKYVELHSDDFIGRDALLRIKEGGVKRKLIGFEMVDKGIARSGYRIYDQRGNVGYVTSGTMSPSLGKAIGLGIVDISVSSDDYIYICVRGKKRKAKIVSFPFYHKN